MQFRDLHRQYERLKPEMDAAIAGVLEDAHYISGPQVKALEESLAQYAGAKHCISCANGTDALSLILHAWGVGPGDAVFVSDFTFFSSAECPACEGATPIFVDVREDTFNMDPDCLERCIQAVQEQGQLKPKAIVAVDIFGLPADFDRIEAIAQKYDLLLLEDGAQAFGGSLNGKMACSFGDASITSFFPAKPLGCYGDGGAVFTDNNELAALIRSLAVHGKGTEKYDNAIPGWTLCRPPSCRSNWRLSSALSFTTLKQPPFTIPTVSGIKCARLSFPRDIPPHGRSIPSCCETPRNAAGS